MVSSAIAFSVRKGPLGKSPQPRDFGSDHGTLSVGLLDVLSHNVKALEGIIGLRHSNCGHALMFTLDRPLLEEDKRATTNVQKGLVFFFFFLKKKNFTVRSEMTTTYRFKHVIVSVIFAK